MNFNWIKKLFKINSNNKGDSFGISTIDTSFIKVPKLSDLSKENQDKVMEYFNEIKYENYETIIKYGDSLLEKSNKEVDFFVHDLEDSIKNITAILNEVNGENYVKLLLYKEEIKLSIEELNKIEEEAELRLIALDTYIKKEEQRKYDFLGIFGKAERLRYLSDKSSLLNERQRLLIAIKLNKQHLQIIYNLLKENKDLLEAMNAYIKNNNTITSLTLNHHLSTFIQGILQKEKFISNDFLSHEIIDLLNNDKIDEERRFVLIAKENRRIKQYAYNHRNDYKMLIDGMNIITNAYEKMPSSKWNIDILDQKIREYIELIDSYVIICERYVSDDILKEIIESLYNMNYLVYITKGKTIGNNHPKPNIIFSIRDVKRKSEEFDYYNKLTFSLLGKIENKYGISQGLLQQYNMYKKNDFEKYDEIQYLYDILNGNFDIFDLKIPTDPSFIYSDDPVKYSVRYLNNIFIENANKDDTFYFSVSHFISIDNLFYLIKFLNCKKYNLDNLFMNEIYPNNKKNKFDTPNNSKIRVKSLKLIEILGKSYLKKLEREYDDRIFVIPKEIEFHQFIDTPFRIMNVRNSLENLNISEKTIAIFVTNVGQLNIMCRALEKDESNIKYFIITETLYDSYKELYKTLDDKIKQQIIIVPDDVKYGELSSHLNKELEKEKNEGKVLSKTR